MLKAYVRQIENKKSILLFICVIVIAAIFMLKHLDQLTQKQIQLSEQKVLQEAIAHFDNIVITRAWNAMYDGVFVKQKTGITPNPYLKNNTLKDEKGNLLIKINPAWMTRQISELANKKSNYYYKITSLKPLNPHNAADEFERQALNYFSLYKEQKYYYYFSADKKIFNFMGALKVEKECLACHDEQGYKIGDIRGGIRVSMPTGVLRNEIKTIKLQARTSLLFIMTATLIVIIVFLRFVATSYRQQRRVETLNQSLEKTVKDRTHSLEQMYQHEKYIKNLLKTVASVNELLLASISVQSVLKNSADELIKHKHYHFTWVGIVKDNLLEVAHKSHDNTNIISQTVYQVKDDANETLAALEAITDKKTIIKPFQLSKQDCKNRRRGDYELHWLIAIPLMTNECDKPFGVFNVYSDRLEGFESEEVSVLERLSTDISLILHSHKQKAILEKMELQRVSNYEETILAFVNIIEQRDTYTAGHTLRVAEYCKKIATVLNIAPAEIKKLEQAAILHDIGKVATPDAVLLKPGKLTSLEYELIKQHAYAGFDMLSKIDMYKDLAQIIRYHHIRYDGTGYPQTASPDDVPFLSHIMVVADAFDAMTTNRIYKPRQTVDNALAEIKSLAGTQFHPVVVEAALKALKDVPISHTNQSPSSELEKKRFSYFFGDALTDLYNENYLQILLGNTERKYHSLYMIFLKHFSHYNRQQGWEQGNKMLTEFAKALKEQFPQAMAFRYHGDDFVLLFEQQDAIDTTWIENNAVFRNTEVNVVVKYHKLQSVDYEIAAIYERLNKKQEG